MKLNTGTYDYELKMLKEDVYQGRESRSGKVNGYQKESRTEVKKNGGIRVKRLFLLVTAGVLISTSAFAFGCDHQFAQAFLNKCVEHPQSPDDWVGGAEFVAPNLVRLNPNWGVGTRVNKNLNQTNANEGWEFWGTLNYTGSILDFSKK